MPTIIDAPKASRPTAKEICYHCGGDCDGPIISAHEKSFCCDGCLTVYDILNANGLCDYYSIDRSPGNKKVEDSNSARFGYLDDPKVRDQFIRFRDGSRTRAVFAIPKIHCSACIWLLENLWKLNPAITLAQVNFLRRELTVEYNEEAISLRGVVELLSKIGYEPTPPDSGTGGTPANKNLMQGRSLALGVAFFCWGNIMLLSFPEYFGLDVLAESEYRQLFGWLNLGLSIPSLFFSGQEFFRSAWTGLKQRNLNIDVPIVLGVLVMFVRSAYEVISGTGAGYFDTLVSLIFLMLVGRIFQNKTYHTLSFERDYKSYFPIGILLVRDGKELSLPLQDIQPGDRLIIRNEELIPADGVLATDGANIDYSFVTGESQPVARKKGDTLYAGGKQVGSAIEVVATKNVSQSYLVQLWNDEAFQKDESRNVATMANRVSRWFTPVIILIALASGAWWWNGGDSARALNAFTAVLIITCPCALALSTPFTLGNALRLLGRRKFYIKNTAALERMAKADTVVFDKTGTLTDPQGAAMKYEGEALSGQEGLLVRSLVRHSTHPLSRRVYEAIQTTDNLLDIQDFEEVTGKGVLGKVDGIPVWVGSPSFVGATAKGAENEAQIWIKVGHKIKGHFSLHNEYRQGFAGMIAQLRNRFQLALLSGDNEAERGFLEPHFGTGAALRFKQSPADKLAYIKSLQAEGRQVIMLGDGLNDAGALKQSQVGIAVSDDINNFSPACDAILDASQLTQLGSLLRYVRRSMTILKTSFAISFLYNIVGIWFASQGILSPLVAAVLMPISSVTIILFTTLATNFYQVKSEERRVKREERRVKREE